MDDDVNFLSNVRISSPCPVQWKSMDGDVKKRLCSKCNLHVYNISNMTNAEARELIETTEGRICALLFRRPDGTIITKDCPVGDATWSLVEYFAAYTSVAVLALIAFGYIRGALQSTLSQSFVTVVGQLGLAHYSVPAAPAPAPVKDVRYYDADGRLSVTLYADGTASVWDSFDKPRNITAKYVDDLGLVTIYTKAPMRFRKNERGLAKLVGRTPKESLQLYADTDADIREILQKRSQCYSERMKSVHPAMYNE